MGVLLGTFMGGMCVGSVLLSPVVSARHHPLRVYAALEAAIGLMGLLLLFVVPLVGRVYVSWAGDGAFGLMLRAMVAAVCLLPPTLAMGATLPAVARWVESTPTRHVVARPLLRRQHRRERWAGRSWRASICCGCTTWRWRPTSRWASIWLSPRRPGSSRDGPFMTTSCASSRHAWSPRPACERAGAGGDCALGILCAVGRSGLDPVLVAAVRRDRLHLRDHPRGLSHRARPWQQRRLGDGRTNSSSDSRARGLSGARRRGDGVDGVHARRRARRRSLAPRR